MNILNLQQITLSNRGGANVLITNTLGNIMLGNNRAMRYICVYFMALFVSICSYAQEPQDTAKVFICTGSAAYAYHTHRDCRGLNRCTATIRTTTAKAAKKEGRKFCGYCKRRHSARTIELRSDKKVTKSEDVL